MFFNEISHNLNIIWVVLFSDDFPDMQLQFIAGSVVSDGGVSLRVNDNVKDSVYVLTPFKTFPRQTKQNSAI